MNRSACLAVMLAAAFIAAPAAGQTAAPSPAAPSPAAPAPAAPSPAAASPDAASPEAPSLAAPGPTDHQAPMRAQAAAAEPPAAEQQQAARIQVYYRVGNWDAFSGRNSRGGAVCGMESTNASDSRNFSVRFDIGGADTTFAASKPGWSIPDGTAVSVVMQIGLNTPWTVRGNGHGHAVEWTLDRDAVQAFDRQFRSAGSMSVTFPDGSEPPWSISLSGSTAISNTFGRCVVDLTRQVASMQPSGAIGPAPRGATQPFTPSGGAPTR